MAKIFISHSQDDPNLDFFHRAFSGTEVKAIWMEFEDIKHPAWRTIAKNVKESSSLFVILNKTLDDEQYEHTQNWISFEVGLACMANKYVWVFEPYGEDIRFVVPYLTHLCKYMPESVDYVKFYKQVVESEGLYPELNSKYGIQCPDCGASFNLLNFGEQYSCPTCRSSPEKIKKLKLSISDFK